MTTAIPHQQDSTPSVGGKPQEYFWWEKTVEYCFVRSILPDLAFAAPLAGTVEKVLGDLLTQDVNGLRLIEFKRTAGDIMHEKDKYPDLAALTGSFTSLLKEHHPNLHEHDAGSAHWFVYGRGPRAGTPAGLQLEAVRYGGDGGSKSVSLDSKKSFEGLPTVPLKVFSEYFNLLLEARLGPVEERGRGGRSGRGLVLATTNSGAIVPIAMDEFELCVQPVPKLIHTPSSHLAHVPRPRIG